MKHPLFTARRLVASIVTTLPLLFSSFAVAQPSPEAESEGRAHFDRGVLLFDQNNFDGALVEFQRAWELSGRPSVLFNIAATFQALHRYGESADALRRFLAEANTPPRQRRQAEATLQELEQLIARVTVTVDPTDAVVLVDGRPATPGQDVLVGPGTHRVEASRTGRSSARGEFTIASGERRTVQVVLPPMTAGAPPPTLLVIDPANPPVSAPVSLPVATPPPSAQLALIGAPTGTELRVDSVLVTHPATLAAGTHRVRVSAPGYSAWDGTINARAGAAHQLRLTLARESAGLSPLWFWTAVGASSVFGLTAIALGVSASNTNAEFRALPSDWPELDAIESRGRSMAIAADVMGVLSLGVGIAAVVLAFRTHFGPRVSTATFVLRPSSTGLTTGWSF